MKARIKATGEIVDVYHESQQKKKKMIYKESVLVNSRMWTEDELELLNEEYDHWQDVRERAAIAAMQGLIANSNNECRQSYISPITEGAIACADELVKRLKGE